jgi:hypothetical protein
VLGQPVDIDLGPFAVTRFSGAGIRGR